MHDIDVVLDSPEHVGTDDLFSGLQNDIHRFFCRVRIPCEVHIHAFVAHVTLKFVKAGVNDAVAVPFCLIHIVEF